MPALTYYNYRILVQDDPCSYCGLRSPFCKFWVGQSHRMTADHVVPKSKGGPNNWENLTSACGRCNGDKGNMDLLSYLLSRL